MKAARCRRRERQRITRPVAPAEHPPKQTTGRWCDQGTSGGPMTRSSTSTRHRHTDLDALVEMGVHARLVRMELRGKVR